MSGIRPGLPQFRELAAHLRVIPVSQRLLADADTPIGLYHRLAGGRPGTFLLESCGPGRSWSRYSIIGVRCPALLTERAGIAHWIGRVPAGVPRTGPLPEVIASTLHHLATPAQAGLPPLTGGLVGYLGYDFVRGLERLPERAADPLALPVVGLLLATDLVVHDALDGSITIIANAVNFDGSDAGVDAAYADAQRRVAAMAVQVRSPARPLRSLALPHDAMTTGSVGTQAVPAEWTRLTSGDRYRNDVRRGIAHVRAGDVFQVVLSQRFEAAAQVDALDVYRALRADNPSPYMYLIRMPGADLGEPGFDIVGSSPEALVTVTGEQVRMHPIAGTRPRGSTREDDTAHAEQLRADDKERAEHLMLVDLGRNDLSRVCTPGSVRVAEFMAIERYSHVMHLVSTLTGVLAPGRTALDALYATFPAGTLTGAPKIRAMEIIEQCEPVRRGVYGGVVGYVDFAGNLDMAIAIRTAVITGSRIIVQAGAGIVAQSDPVNEDAECLHKAHAVLRAVAAART